VKLKLTFLSITMVVALLFAALLPTNPTLATEPDPDQSKIGNLKSKIDEMWTSGWVDIATSESIEFTHNMGGDIEDYAIQLWFRDTDAGGYGVNNRAYGGDEDNGVWLGAFWRSLDNATISVARQPADVMADQVRVWIWPSEADLEYCTNWSPIAPIPPSPSTTTWAATSTITRQALVPHHLSQRRSPDLLWQRRGWREGVWRLLAWPRRYPDPGQPRHRRHRGRRILPVRQCARSARLGQRLGRHLCRRDNYPAPQPGRQRQPLHRPHGVQGGAAKDRRGADGHPPPCLWRHRSNLLAEDAAYMGANWQNLTPQSITLYRWADDPLPTRSASASGCAACPSTCRSFSKPPIGPLSPRGRGLG